MFTVVRDARDLAIARVKDAVSKKKELRGFEVDDAAREHVRAQGFEEFFFHRTGHSIGTEVHGSGANMDNLETHDERRVIPWTCFSVEPGIYLPEFGDSPGSGRVCGGSRGAGDGRGPRQIGSDMMWKKII